MKSKPVTPSLVPAPTVRRSRIRRGPALSARRDLGRARRQFRAVLGPCHARSSSACSTSDGEQRARAHRPARIHRRGLARLPARRAARHGLRLSRARPLRARGRAPLQPQQAPARSLRQAARRHGSTGTRPCSATRWRAATTSPSTSATARPSCRSAASSIPAFTWGRERRPRTSLGEDDHLRDARARLHHAPPGRARATCAAPMPASATPSVRRLHPHASASRPSSCCRSTTFVDDSYLIDKGLRNYWGYNTIAFFAPARRYAANAASSPSPSSRRWSRTCTTPASR